MTWHLSPEAVTRYGTGVARGAEAASAEAHLVTCASCRTAVAPYADTSRLDRVLADVTDVLDRPRPGAIERALHLLHVPDGTARLLVATPAMRLSWLLSIAGALVFALFAARGGEVEEFVLLAPVLPVLGVAIAYGPAIDGAFEVTVAAPFSGLRLLLLRAGTVLAATAGMTGLASLALPGSAMVAVWLLPALALTAATLALGTSWDTTRAAATVGGGWLLSVTAAIRRDVDVTGPATQLLCLLLLVAAATVLAARRDRYEQGVGA